VVTKSGKDLRSLRFSLYHRCFACGYGGYSTRAPHRAYSIRSRHKLSATFEPKYRPAHLHWLYNGRLRLEISTLNWKREGA